jgi:hypothetical protein
MKVLIRPKPEKEILAPTSSQATAEKILEGLLVRSENCVESRCGCGTCTS